MSANSQRTEREYDIRLNVTLSADSPDCRVSDRVPVNDSRELFKRVLIAITMGAFSLPPFAKSSVPEPPHLCFVI
jgi:hypothetical protein